MLVYVDDIIVTGNDTMVVSSVISVLGSRFTVKDQGDINYFLGIKVTRTSNGLHLMQRKYILDLLTKTNMLDAKIVSTPMQQSPKLSITSGKQAISWSSKKQNGVARSSTEAEYRAIANTAAEIRWICNLMSELKIRLPTAPVIYCDNMGATYLSANPVFHSRMKHIALDYHFVRGQVQQGSLRVSHVPADDQLADALTKPLGRASFHKACSKIGVTAVPPS